MEQSHPIVYMEEISGDGITRSKWWMYFFFFMTFKIAILSCRKLVPVTISLSIHRIFFFWTLHPSDTLHYHFFFLISTRLMRGEYLITFFYISLITNESKHFSYCLLVFLVMLPVCVLTYFQWEYSPFPD